VVAAEGLILDLSNSAQHARASTISVSQPPDDTPIGSEGAATHDAREQNEISQPREATMPDHQSSRAVSPDPP
jgi:hypothetical protein